MAPANGGSFSVTDAGTEEIFLEFVVNFLHTGTISEKEKPKEPETVPENHIEPADEPVLVPAQEMPSYPPACIATSGTGSPCNVETEYHPPPPAAEVPSSSLDPAYRTHRKEKKNIRDILLSLDNPLAENGPVPAPNGTTFLHGGSHPSSGLIAVNIAEKGPTTSKDTPSPPFTFADPPQPGPQQRQSNAHPPPHQERGIPTNANPAPSGGPGQEIKSGLAPAQSELPFRFASQAMFATPPARMTPDRINLVQQVPWDKPAAFQPKVVPPEHPDAAIPAVSGQTEIDMASEIAVQFAPVPSHPMHGAPAALVQPLLHDAHHVVRQLAQHIYPAAREQIEITLAPEELGKVRLVVTAGDSPTVTVLADNPDTLELLRRNSDLLARELRESGFSGASLSFGDGGGGTHHSRGGPAEFVQPTGTTDTAPEIAPTDQGLQSSDRRIDIRI